MDPPPPPEVLAATLPVGAPWPGPNGGKLCQGCGREFSALWRVVVVVNGSVQERFVCGTSAVCQPPSLVPAAQV